MTLTLVPAIVVLAAVVLAIFGLYSVLTDLILRDRSRLSERVDLEFRKEQREQAKKSPLFKNLGQVAAEVLANEEARPGLRQRFLAMVEQSGMDLTPGRLLTWAVAVGLALGAGCGLLRRSAIIGGLAAPLGAAIPILYVALKRARRIDKLRGQLPEAFDLMARVVRAGQTMSQALQAVADEFPLPISGEFAYCYEQQNLGLSPEATFRDLNRRTGLIELKIFVLAVLIQQQTGGNLAELLNKLAAIVRDRFRIRGVIKTLTAEGRLQGFILLLLPVAMFFIMLVLNPNYAMVLLEHKWLIVVTAACMMVGAFWIQKIVNFDF